MGKKKKWVKFFPFQYKIELKDLDENLIQKIKQKKLRKIALAATVQFIPVMKEIEKELKKRGLKVFVGKGNERIAEKGMVLGCNYSAIKKVEKNAEAVLFIGDGLFHAIGISFVSKKPMFTFNPLNNSFKELRDEREIFLRKRFGLIAKAAESKSFGLVVSSKQGQFQKQKVLELRKKIELKGKKAFIFVTDFVKPEYFLGMEGIDCFVNTACPRIALDDFTLFKKPIINPSELLIALKEKKLDEFKVDELI
jgi:2-(3-amino-3-carboxypropyl)histidine synthase